MVIETRKRSMAWMEMDYKYPTKDSPWKIKWRQELLGALRDVPLSANNL